MFIIYKVFNLLFYHLQIVSFILFQPLIRPFILVFLRIYLE